MSGALAGFGSRGRNRLNRPTHPLLRPTLETEEWTGKAMYSICHVYTSRAFVQTRLKYRLDWRPESSRTATSALLRGSSETASETIAKHDLKEEPQNGSA